MRHSLVAQSFGGPTGVFGILAILLLLLAALLGPSLLGEAASRFDLDNAMRSSSAQHWLGTDELGRDVLARIVVATRLSLFASIAATIAGALLGIAIGVIPAVTNRRIAGLVNAAVNLALAFPLLLLALFVTAIAGAGLRSAMLAISIAIAPTFARLTQNLAASVQNADYVAAARLLGAGRLAIVTRHIVPNIAAPLIVTGIMVASSALVVLSGLSFLGLGVQPPQYDWGTLLSQGLSRIYVNPAPALAAAAAIVFTGLAFSFAGESLARAMRIHGTTSRRRRHVKSTARHPVAQLAEEQADLLDVRGLSVLAHSDGATAAIVRELALSMRAGERVALVGESGSGKTMAALAIAQLLDGRAVADAQRLDFLHQSLLSTDRDDLRRMRHLLGASLSVVFQEPLGSFNPTLRIGVQLAEVATTHQALSRSQALARAVDRLRRVHLSEPDRRVTQYPHEFSGGMLQRSMIAMGLMAQPRLIIADEPTTALDVTVQEQILALLRQVCTETGAGLLLISHDLAVVTHTCERVLVMYAGRIVEDLTATQLLERPAHPYTLALLDSALDMNTDRAAPLKTLPGRAPQPGECLEGCAFAARCASATAICSRQVPVLRPLAQQHQVACWNVATAPGLEAA